MVKQKGMAQSCAGEVQTGYQEKLVDHKGGQILKQASEQGG